MTIEKEEGTTASTDTPLKDETTASVGENAFPTSNGNEEKMHPKDDEARSRTPPDVGGPKPKHGVPPEKHVTLEQKPTHRLQYEGDFVEEVDYAMPEPPDGGWGWVVVFCSFMIHVIVDGITYTSGIFYTEFLDYFGESKAATSWITSIMVGTTFCVGPFASGLTNQFGCRAVTIAGSLLAAFGLLISTFAPSITFLYFSIGICAGTGFGLMYLPAIVCVTCYFEKKRAFATGVAVCGSGIGTFLLAPVTDWMVAEYGWKGAMLITAGFALNCCVFGTLFRPLGSGKPAEVRRRARSPALAAELAAAATTCNGNGHLRKGSLPNGTLGSIGGMSMTPLRTDHRKQSASMTGGINHHHHHPPHAAGRQVRSASVTLSYVSNSSRRSSLHLREGPLARKDVFYSGSVRDASNLYLYDIQVQGEAEAKAAMKKSLRTRIRDLLCPPVMQEAFREMTNFALMRDPIFLMFGVSNFLTNIGFNVPYVYTKDRTLRLGLADSAAAGYLLSVIGIANTVGRVILGFLSDRSCVNRLWLYNGSLTLCGAATALSAFCLAYYQMGIYAAVFGATSGAYVSLTSVILVDLLGLEKLTNAFGLLLLFEGIACLIGPPITGWLYDFTGSYDPGFYVSGVMIALSGLMLFFIPCVQRAVAKRQKIRDDPEGIAMSSPVPPTPVQ